MSLRRPCLVCGTPVRGRSRCPACQANTTGRGYGHQHQKLRARIQPQVDAGRARCWRCGKPINPGEPWDLGHDDDDRTRYRGPEHPGCNRRGHR